MFIGIDVGTTNVKACIINNSGKIIAISSCKSRVDLGPGGIAEQDGNEIWQSVQAVLRDVLRKVGVEPSGVKAGVEPSGSYLSLSTQGGTIFFLDKQNKYVRPGITWMDTRPKAGTADRKLYAITGRSLSIGCLPLLQLLWLKKNEPETLKRTVRYEFVDSLIYKKLTGRSVIDPSSAVMTMLYDVKQGKWSDDLLKMPGIAEDQLPEILPSGELAGAILPPVAKLLGLPEGLKIICGGHDQYCAALGAGVVNPGDIMLSCGTAWALVGVWHKPIFKFGSDFSPGPHAVRGKWGMLTSMGTTGAFFDRMIKILNFKDYREALLKAGGAPDGCAGLLFFLLDGGKGVFQGIGLHHDRSFLLRSVMEGLGFEVARRIKILERLGIKPTSITMVGGAAKSKEWVRIISNITRLKVKVPQETESACRGAAVNAANKEVSSGKWQASSLKQETACKIYTPTKKSKKVYAEAVRKYEKYQDRFARLDA